MQSKKASIEQKNIEKVNSYITGEHTERFKLSLRNNPELKEATIQYYTSKKLSTKKKKEVEERLGIKL